MSRPSRWRRLRAWLNDGQSSRTVWRRVIGIARGALGADSLIERLEPCYISGYDRFQRALEITAPDEHTADKLRRSYGGIIERALAMIFGQSTDETVPAREAAREDDDRGWRALSATVRDPSPSEWRDALTRADEAWRTNPVAFRVTELTAEMVLGRGMALRSEDEGTQALLDAWWHHPQNALPDRQYRLFRELYLTGDLFVAFFTNPYDGMTYLRTIPSALIDQVETSPGDLEAELRFHQVAQDGRPERWWSAEEMAHYALDRVEGATRGMAPIAPSLPWIRRYRDWLVDRVRVNRAKGSFLWDVTLKGADRAAILARQADLATPPPPGSVTIHNESEEWRSVVANVDASEAAADGKAIRRMFTLGAGFPMHFLAEADDANRATAHEQQMPVNLHMQRMQASFGYFVADMARRAALRSGRFDTSLLGSIVPVFAESDVVDNLAVAQAGKLTADAVAIALDRGLLTQEQATRLLLRVFGELLDEADPTRANQHGQASVPERHPREPRSALSAVPTQGFPVSTS